MSSMSARRIAQASGIKVTEVVANIDAGMGYCWRCRQWLERELFDTDCRGYRYRYCRECRGPGAPVAKPVKKQHATVTSVAWSPPPAAVCAAREFLTLMDVPAEWQVPRGRRRE